MLSAAMAVGTWGNISRRVGEGLMAITPSGMGYRSIGPGDVAAMRKFYVSGYDQKKKKQGEA